MFTYSFEIWPSSFSLLFFKERFLPKEHPGRPKIDRFSTKLRKLDLREETIGYGPTKEKWEAWNHKRQRGQPDK